MLVVLHLLLRLTAGPDVDGWSLSAEVLVRGDGTHLLDLMVDATEVSRGQYYACLDAKVCQRHGAGPSRTPTRRTEMQPMALISRDDAEGYCAARGRRLPTEAEWDWIARSRGKEENQWKRPEDRCRFAVLHDEVEGLGCGFGEPWPVDSMRSGATAQGVLHTAGNVSEWTATTLDGAAVVRGGSAYSLSLDGLFERRTVPPTVRDSSIGFRCVMEVR